MQTWPEVGDGVSGRGAQSMVRFGSGYFGQGRRGGGAGDEEVLPPGGGEENGVHRRQLELHVGAEILRRHREKGRNIKRDVGRTMEAPTRTGAKENGPTASSAPSATASAPARLRQSAGSWAPGNPTASVSLRSQAGATNRGRRTGGTILGDADIPVSLWYRCADAVPA